MFVFHPLETNTWQDLQTLFGENGACGGCWCMYWRLAHSEYESNKGEGNMMRLRELVYSGNALGVLAYAGEKPVGWCSVSPRGSLTRLRSSRLFRPVDDRPVWSITCLYIDMEYRRKGMSGKLIQAAVNYAFEKGAEMIEAYPIISGRKDMPDTFSWVGFDKAFRESGFTTVSQPSDTRLYMRLER